MGNTTAGSGQERNLAVFIDFENLALGFSGRRKKEFDIHRVLDRLVEKGKVLVKTAYADWGGKFREYTKELHESGVELIEIPKRSQTGKNSADIRLCVDAMDLSYSKEHINTFVVVSGDSDFSPLVSKLKENGKYVIGLGMKKSTSKLLADNCDEFLYYEDLGEEETPGATPSEGKKIPADKRELYFLLFDVIRALQRENYEVIYSSLVKDTMKRKRPSFNESSYGFRSFSELLEDAQEAGHISLKTDERSGTYVVTRLNYGRRRRRRS
ncbi:MAG: NYN domain-containing protein [Candidatus Eisenbacteria bacterium]|nr:NYN domain-containing protein [Candidatus Eisenbacteria bacterium]